MNVALSANASSTRIGTYTLATSGEASSKSARKDSRVVLSAFS